MTKFVLENFYIMGFNLKNARNGKSASKIPQGPSTRPLNLKSKFIRQFEFSGFVWKMLLETSYSLKNSDVQIVVNSHSLMMGASTWPFSYF